MTLTSASLLASHFKVFRQSFFYVMGKALSDELSCTETDLVHINSFKTYVMTPY